ncbi:MAG: ABC transporter permease [Clostridiales bacterium]|nr:ABC transporter permease [Clostridiales bacterium]
MTRSSNIVSKYAKRTVFKNRSRSILTLIGIIIATMMFSIVSSAHQSAIDILKSFANDDYGTWHVEAYSMTSMDFQNVIKDDRIKRVAYIQEIGFNPWKGFQTEYSAINNAVKYIDQYEYFLAAMSPDFPEMCNISIVRGRLPQNSSEVIISLEMFSDDRENLEIGSEIDMDYYARYSSGHKVMNLQNLQRDKAGFIDEQVFAIGEQKYTIVGYFTVPEYSKWRNIAANTMLTCSDGVMAGSAVNAFFEFKDPSVYTQFTQDHFENEDDCLYNKDYIRMENSADDTRIQRRIAIVSGGTIGMIVLLAVMLIYNSFASSSSERLRAIGLLKSVGATRRQVKELMFTEAFIYSVIGIPIGLLLGHVSSFFLFRSLSEMGSNAANYFIVKNIDLQYRIGYQNIIAPVVLSLLTIFAAVMIPVIQVSKVLPMEAVRANESYAQGHDKKRYHALATRIFGFTGALSLKNYQRYRKRYLATVISIMASVFMILFANMLVNSVAKNYQIDEGGSENTIRYLHATGTGGFTDEDQALFYMLQSVDTVRSGQLVYATTAQIQPSEWNFVSREVGADLRRDSYSESYIMMSVVFIDDASWRDICSKNDIDPDPFLEYGSNLCLMNNHVTLFEENGNVYYEGKAFNKIPTEMGMDINEENYPDFIFKLKPLQELDLSDDLQLYESYVQIYVPLSRLDYYHMRSLEGFEVFRFEAGKPVSAVAQMKEILSNNLYLSDTLVDAGINVRARHAVNSLVKIIMYGYVAMLSLMCFINVIMTVISNIVFRRKEYILLTSVGMSRKTLFRMVISESLIYFFESIILLMLIMFVSMEISVLFIDSGIPKYLNVPYLLIVIFLHLLVVVSTTAIGLSRIMRDEIIEGIRKDYY